MVDYKFAEIRAWQCTCCGEIFEDIDDAGSCMAERCPYPDLGAGLASPAARKEDTYR